MKSLGANDMDDLMLEGARRELAELTKQMEATKQRIAELEVFIRVAATIALPSQQQPTDRARLSLPAQSEKPLTFKDQVIAMTEEMLATTRWMKTKQIVERLEQNGVTINTRSNKVVRVSSILVKQKDKFSSSRKRGWTLRQARIDSTKSKGPSARTLSPLGTTTSHRGQPTLAALSSD
jgi:hypothetical protein